MLDNLQISVKPKTVHCEKSEKNYKQKTNVDLNESNDDINEKYKLFVVFLFKINP